MDKSQYLLFLLVGFTVFLSVNAIKCYQCNVWLKGHREAKCVFNVNKTSDYGVQKDNCKICVKVESVHIGGRHPQKYGSGFQIENRELSRVCGGPVDAKRFTNWCQHFTAAGGYIRRCYCSTDFCNSSSKVTATFSVFFMTAIAYLIARIQ